MSDQKSPQAYEYGPASCAERPVEVGMGRPYKTIKQKCFLITFQLYTHVEKTVGYKVTLQREGGVLQAKNLVVAGYHHAYFKKKTGAGGGLNILGIKSTLTYNLK